MQKNIKFKAFSLMELSIVILIVGLLIAGIFKSKNLLQDFRTQSAQKQTLSSPVNTIRDLVLWYETSSTNSFDKAETTDGATITNWYDLNPQSSASDKNDATAHYGTVLYEK
jgi:prepilin-type N-terminal cleavage/methylation domain-containing protein